LIKNKNGNTRTEKERKPLRELPSPQTYTRGPSLVEEESLGPSSDSFHVARKERKKEKGKGRKKKKNVTKNDKKKTKKK